MKITYDNIVFSLQRAGGISVYWAKLIMGLSSRDINISYYGDRSNNIFAKNLKIKVRKESIIPTNILRYLPFRRRLDTGSLFHSSYYRVSLQKDIKNVVTVHDFTHEYFRSGLARFVHHNQKKFALKKADGIICVSESTKKDMLKFFPGIKNKPIRVIHLAASDDFTVENRTHDVSKEFKKIGNIKYILYVGSRANYKNFDYVVHAIKKLPSYKLVVVGEEFSVKEARVLKDNLKDRFKLIKHPSIEELSFLYRRAFCFIYPSSYEGFGIPILEAMQSGCPVVALRTSSIPEVSGEAALLMDRLSINSIIEQVRSLEKGQTRDRLIKAGLEQSRKFSWDRCVDQTYDFYRELIINKTQDGHEIEV